MLPDCATAAGLAPDSDPALAWTESLTTRLCHDMAGLVATLSGTLEMVLEDQGADTDAASLATDAARMLAVRLRLYRAAWGGGDMEQASLDGLAEGLPNRGRLTLDLAALDEARGNGMLDEGACRLALCLLLAASAGMPMGGTMRARLTRPGSGAPGFQIEVDGKRAGWPVALAAGAGQPAGTAAALAAPLARMVAASIGWQLSLDGEVLTASPG